MGIVYLAKDPLIGRLVALKTIRPASHSDDEEVREFQQRFIREAQAAGILNHPAIVTVHDIGQDDTTQINFIAMEYVEGHNLKEILAQGRPLTFEAIGDIIAQIADALDFAHSKGIIHRDVKPANIILLDGNRAKIMDFGIAKIASGVANLTTTGQFLGTPNYMAPEQIKGTPVDGRTDIFSLGICLYECLTRRKPFGGDSLTSISYKIVHEPFPPLHEINPQIPDGFEEVVAGCLAKDPTKRFQRGRELANALRAVVRGEKPAKQVEPMMVEETVVTRDRERIPTVEMPFPEAASLADQYARGEINTSGARLAIAGAGGGTAAVAAPGIATRPAHGRFGQQLRRTLDNVRTFPAWRRLIPMPVAIGVVMMLLVALVAGAVAIRRQNVAVPKVDAATEARRARERRLRAEANEYLRRGNVTEAYARFEELSKLAPNSPAITLILHKLATIRSHEELSRQQLLRAGQKREEGIALFNEKKFTEAIAVLQEAFSLNPSDVQTANYLMLAQGEEQKMLAAKAIRPKPPPVQKAATTPTTATRTAATGPAELTTVFNSPFSDGYIMVRAGADVVAHENLWEEKGRFIRRRYPRVVNVTKQLTPKDTDVEIWVVVDSQKIREHHRVRHNFQPGSSQKLIVSFNPQNKTFNYVLN